MTKSEAACHVALLELTTLPPPPSNRADCLMPAIQRTIDILKGGLAPEEPHICYGTEDKGWGVTEFPLEPSKRPFRYISHPLLENSQWPRFCYLQGHKIGNWSAEWLAVTAEEYQELMAREPNWSGFPEEAKVVEAWNRIFERHARPQVQSASAPASPAAASDELPE